MVEMKSFKFKQIGGKIAYYRKLRKLTQEQLAQKINISSSTLSKIERGMYNKNISILMLNNIAEGLDVKLVWLIELDEQEFKIAQSTEKATPDDNWA